VERWHRPLGAIERSRTALGRQAELQMLRDRSGQSPGGWARLTWGPSRRQELAVWGRRRGGDMLDRWRGTYGLL